MKATGERTELMTQLVVCASIACPPLRKKSASPLVQRLMHRIIICSLALASAGAAGQTTADSALFEPTSVDVGGRSGDMAIADVNRDGHLDLHRRTSARPDGVRAPGRLERRIRTRRRWARHHPRRCGRVRGRRFEWRSRAGFGRREPDEQREYVGVLLGDGAGRFTPASGSAYPTGSSFAFYKPVLRLADINEDGRVDIVSVNGRRNSIEILFGDGRGGFAVGPRVMLDAGGDFYTSDLADVDSDGHLDVVAASGDGRADRVVLKRGDGGAGVGGSLALPSTPPRPRVVALADVNGDARIDVVVAHGEIRRLTVLLNRDGRTFTTAAGSPDTLAAEAFEVQVADVNRDGKADSVATVVDSQTRPYMGHVAVLLGSISGFSAAPGSPFRAGRGA